MKCYFFLFSSPLCFALFSFTPPSRLLQFLFIFIRFCWNFVFSSLHLPVNKPFGKCVNHWNFNAMKNVILSLSPPLLGERAGAPWSWSWSLRCHKLTFLFICFYKFYFSTTCQKPFFCAGHFVVVFMFWRLRMLTLLCFLLLLSAFVFDFCHFYCSFRLIFRLPNK